jgi:Peptidase family M23
VRTTLIRRPAVIALVCALACMLLTGVPLAGAAPFLSDRAGRAASLTPAVSKGLNGWYWPTGTENLGSMGGWMQYRPGGTPNWHLAKDIGAAYGSPVYALTDGTVFDAYAVLDGYAPAGAIVVLYRNENGDYFKALYGHVKSLQYRKGAKVKAGAVIGYIGQSNPYHLHFGIHPGAGLPTDPQHNVFRGHTYVKSQTYGWTDPVAYLHAHSPYVPPKPVTLSLPLLPSSIPAGRIVSVAATMTPTHDFSTGLLRLERWRPAGAAWELAGSDPMRQRRDEPVARASVLLPVGTWRLRTRFAGDRDHLPGVSGWVTVIAR